jgi:hypothetical protein
MGGNIDQSVTLADASLHGTLPLGAAGGGNFCRARDLSGGIGVSYVAHLDAPPSS